MIFHRTDRLPEVLARTIVESPIRVLLLALLMLVACISGVRHLEPNFTYRAFFSVEDPLRQQIDRFEHTFGNDDSVVLLVHSPSGIVDEESSRLIVDLTERMWMVPDVVRVDSLSNYSWVRAHGDEILVESLFPDTGLTTDSLRTERSSAIQAEPLIPEYLLSADGKTTMIVGYVRDAGESSPEGATIVNAVREMVETVPIGDHTFHITGRMAIMAAMQESAQSDMQKILPYVLITIVALIVIATRRAKAVFATMALIVATVGSTMGIGGWLGLEISVITAMVPQFVLAISVASAAHILMTYRRCRRLGDDRRLATSTALRENFLPTFLTALTTSIAFVSFASANIAAIGNLGIMVGAGAVLAWIYTYLLLGSLLALLPEIRARNRSSEVKGSLAQPGFLASRASGLVDVVATFPIVIVIASVLIVSGAVYIASNNVVNSNPFRYFDKEFWLRQSADFAEANLRGSQGIEVVVKAGNADGVKSPEFMRKAEEFQNWIAEHSFVAKTVSVIDFLKRTNQALHGDDPAYYRLPDSREQLSEQLFLYTMNLPEGLDLSNRVSFDGDAIRISVRWTLYDSAVATDWARRIEAKAAALDLDVETTGKMLLLQRMNGYVSQALAVSLGIALLLISATLLTVFRSLKIGIASLMVNVAPLCIGAAVLAAAGNDIDTGAVVALTACLGVAVDDTIHLLHAIRASSAETSRAAVKEGLIKVLPAITLTTLILVIGFGAFMLGDFVPNQNFGLMAISILASAWLFDLILLPALWILINPAHVGRDAEVPAHA